LVAKRVLVVEDNELNLKLFCDLLRVHGHETSAVKDGRDAYQRARDFLPDLIITDIQLPHVTGLDLIAELRADPQLAGVPIMAVTAYAGMGDEGRIREAGANVYVSKPISVMRFMEVVNGLFALGAESGSDGPKSAARAAI
jgi:two-component system cell cycle response regulator DivK